MFFACLFAVGCGQDAQQADQSGAQPTSNDQPAKNNNPTKAAPEKASIPRLTDTMPSSISSPRGEAKTGDSPQADYDRIDTVEKAGKAAVGKTILIRASITNLQPPGKNVSIKDCVTEYEGLSYIEGTYTKEQVQLVRAVQTSKFSGECPRILMKIKGFTVFEKPLVEIIDIYDVQPDPRPAKTPAGVDYISTADALLDGDQIVGRVIDVSVYMADDISDIQGVPYHKVYTQNCSDHGGHNAFILIKRTEETIPILDAMPKGELDPRGCQRVRVKITGAPDPPAHPTKIVGDLIGVGEPSKLPERRPTN